MERLGFRAAWAACLALAVLSAPAMASELDDGVAAYHRKDYVTALRILRPLAEQGGDEAQLYLGLMYDGGLGVGRDYSQAMDWYLKSADTGNAVAKFNIGAMYSYGKGMPKDRAQAAAWYRKSADQGYSVAQNNLGELYYVGEGVPKSYEEAVKWWRLAAAQGQRNAQTSMGWVYMQGHGVPRDYKQAVYWNRLAADQGQAEGQNNLGELYAAGHGVPVDLYWAHLWWKKAAGQGSAEAGQRLTALFTPAPGARHELSPADKAKRDHALKDLERGRYRVALPIVGEIAEAGDPVAQRVIGQLFQEGFAKSPQLDDANTWLSKAAAGGDRVALWSLYRLFDTQARSETEWLNGRPPYATRMYDVQRKEWVDVADLEVPAGVLSGKYKFPPDAELLVQKESGEFVTIRGAAATEAFESAHRYVMKRQRDDLNHADFFKKSADELLPPAAKAGDPEAQFILGISLKRDVGRQQEAADWLRQAAGHGHAQAAFTLGMMYAQGELKKDFQQARHWLETAANSGPPYLQYDVGEVFEKGEVLPEDIVAALKMYRGASERGFDKAQYAMGRLYENGTGVKRDYGHAYFWYLLASAHQGDEGADRETAKSAGEAKDRVKAKLSPAQLIATQKQVQTWKEKD